MIGAERSTKRIARSYRSPAAVMFTTGMRLDHGGLLVSDVERAVRFYTGALGLEQLPRPSTFDTPGAWLKVGEQRQIHLIGETEAGRARAMHPAYDRAEIAIGYGNHLARGRRPDAALARAAEHSVLPGGEVIARGDGVSPRSSPTPTTTCSVDPPASRRQVTNRG